MSVFLKIVRVLNTVKRPLARFLSPYGVYFLRPLAALGKYHDLVLPDLHKAAGKKCVFPFAVSFNLYLAYAQRDHRGLMALEYAELSRLGLAGYLLDLAFEKMLFGSDYLCDIAFAYSRGAKQI